MYVVLTRLCDFSKGSNFIESNKPYKLTVSDRIAQIVFHHYEVPSFVTCNELSKVTEDWKDLALQALKNCKLFLDLKNLTR